ncbi:hypothetical protein OEZ49_12420 [Ruegeria sp. WL0004]|uniref:Uncharacterized protein n=1 Tax=Ruegeria marisflavi TaxID=2984152 RepID=A0ABT2WRP2_9RHOB|nr:hypothetical protein [Ruegeria sp. WL0004]MCU9838575.1 hypothetical protein [Ruegeria sp. WL0004]
MILHTDTALMIHRPTHLQPLSQEERAATRLVIRRRHPTSELANRLFRYFAFWQGAKVS